MARPDVLLLSLGTTLGWRVADRRLLDQIERAGASAAVVTVRFGAAGRLRRGYPVNDLVEMHAARRALSTALQRHEPRALVVSTTTASMLLPPLRIPYAVRIDAPARMNRPGARNALLRALERRAMARARAIVPLSEAAARELPEGAAPAIVVPPPIEPSGPAEGERGRIALAYVPDPKAKGLDVLARAWALAEVPDATLEVHGLDPDRARSHLRRAGVPEPPGLRLSGTSPAEEFRGRLRQARVFVASARWEDFGQAPLEALADGALLATVPSGGPYEALRLARALDPSLVAGSIEPAALAPAIRAAFELPGERARAYRERTRELMRPYSPEAVQRVVGEELLPALLRDQLR